MNDKLVLPWEFRTCATCSYWDGDRRVDGEVHVVVVSPMCVGECLVAGQSIPGLLRADVAVGCLWEPLDDSPLPEEAKPAP